MSNRDRDLEITRRREAGESPTDLARAFNVSPERVWQIVTATQRRLRGEPPKRRKRDQARDSTTVRPRLRPIDGRMDGRWSCACDVLARQGATPKEAYDLWLHAATLAAMPTGSDVAEAPKAPAAVETSHGPAITPVHESQVQVVRGAAPRQPLQFASSLGLNAERIAAAQPRMQSLHGVRRAANGGFHDQE